eukprot:6212284-Pleurochrysis_carterae.AAC.1
MICIVVSIHAPWSNGPWMDTAAFKDPWSGTVAVPVVSLRAGHCRTVLRHASDAGPQERDILLSGIES